MSVPLTGTATFLFTDIESSTRLWEQHSAAMKMAVAQHDAILRRVVEGHTGYVVKTTGDGLLAAFGTADQALAAALQAQRDLLRKLWGETGPLRVRMALHSGPAEERDGDYFGPALNRAARLMAAGHGGQTLLSQATFELVRDQLPEGVTLRNLGEHRLKDLARPEHIYQVIAPDLPTDFPPLKTLDARANNLPVLVTPLVDRAAERAAVRNLLGGAEARLVSLIGPGGTGKTRLALAVAEDLVGQFADGVFFVDLALVDDPNLVASTIARTLNLHEEPARALLDTLLDYLHDKTILLVLDNFEQVMSAAPLVAHLMSRCPRLKLLVTSREVLDLRAAREVEVTPLDTPNPDSSQSLSDLMGYPAIELFVQRARGARSDFALTAANADTISAICYRLDGLPLAIELAAARIRLLSPKAMLQQMDDSLHFLTGGPRDLPTRQQTLRATLDWSHQLLDEEDRTLFRRLAVFAGGFTLEAVEAVCRPGNSETDMLGALSSLLDKSLIRRQQARPAEAAGMDAVPRFAMLGTIREYAQTQLLDSGEAEALGERHALLFLALAEEGEPHLRGAAQVEWQARLELEHDNLRAALAWSEKTKHVEIGWRLAAALLRFWMHGSLMEAQSWLARLLHLGPPTEPTRAWARVLFTQAALNFDVGDVVAAQPQFERAEAVLESLGDQQGLAYSLTYHSRTVAMLGDFAAARSLAERSLDLFRQVGDQWGVAEALHNLGHVDMEQGDFDAPRSHFQQSVALFRALGDREALTGPLSDLGQIAYQRGDYQEARARFEESVAISRDLNDQSRLAYWLLRLGDLARSEDNDEQAKAYYEDALAIYQALGSQFSVPTLLHHLGTIAQRQGRHDEARDFFIRTLEMLPPPGRERERAQCLAGLAAVWAARGHPAEAASLFGAAQLVLAPNPPPTPADRVEVERTVAALRRTLVEAEWQARQAQGQAMTLEQAIAYAMAEL